MTKRCFTLLACLCTLAGAVLGALPADGPAKDPQPPAAVALIDTHTHFYDPTRPQGIPWPAQDDRVLYRKVLPEHFLALTRPHNVGGTIVVEASPWVEDNQWLLDLAAKNPVIVGVVGRLIPGEKGFREHLQRFAKNPLFRGIRINSGELKRGLEQQAFRADLKQLADLDLTLDVNGGPELLPDVARAARLLPQLRIVINHAANLRIDGKAVPADWLAGIRAAARGRNVYCKVSALVEGTGRQNMDAPKELAYYRPVLDVLWQEFGKDRLLYGSNWPVSERFASYATVIGIVREYFDARGQEATAKFFRHNSVAAYRWGKR